MAFLLHKGAARKEAQDLTDSLWADCIVARPGSRARLATYCGRAPLQAWLKAVTLNELIRLRRQEKRWGEVFSDDEDRRIEEKAGPEASPRERTEPPLIALMNEAIDSAFQSCPAEDFVLLQLAHADRLLGEELGKIFACSAATISRQLKRAQVRIKEATLAHIKLTDPWLELKWDDFLELCRFASPAFLGAE
jgi:RNA polymerase sigma factor (sigma-70 family)